MSIMKWSKAYCYTCSERTEFYGPYCTECHRWDEESFNRVVAPRLKKVRKRLIDQTSRELLAFGFRKSLVQKVRVWLKENDDFDIIAELLSN